jgi:hypothetical protein
MTAIKPNNTELRQKINDEKYNLILNQINSKYTEMNKYINNLQRDIAAILEFENILTTDQQIGYDIGSALDTLSFQRISLQIDLYFFINMKDTYIKKLYGDLYKYLESIIDTALTIEILPDDTSVKQLKQSKLKNLKPYPPPKNDTSNTSDILYNINSNIEEKYDMNEIFELINVITYNLRELADDITSFSDRINNAIDKENRGFSIGNLIMNLKLQQQKLCLEFNNYIIRLEQFLIQNKDFSNRCLHRITLISKEIISTEELEETTPEIISENTPENTSETISNNPTEIISENTP